MSFSADISDLRQALHHVHTHSMTVTVTKGTLMTRRGQSKHEDKEEEEEG